MGERALSDRFFSQNILQIVQNILKDTSQRIKEHTLIRQSGERSQAGSTGWWLGVRWEPGSKMAKSDPKSEEGKVRNWNKSSEQSVWWRVKNETGPHLNLPPQCTGARKIGPVPQQVLSPRWKIRNECNVCDTAASAFKSLPSLHSWPPLPIPPFLTSGTYPIHSWPWFSLLSSVYHHIISRKDFGNSALDVARLFWPLLLTVGRQLESLGGAVERGARNNQTRHSNGKIPARPPSTQLYQSKPEY